jgi:hypothetical protein
LSPMTTQSINIPLNRGTCSALAMAGKVGYSSLLS